MLWKLRLNKKGAATIIYLYEKNFKNYLIKAKILILLKKIGKIFVILC